MNLLCAESLVVDNRFAERDPVMFDDIRVLENLLQTEHRFIPSCNYFETVQTDLKPFMRKVVITWMLEVCEDQRCENQVFPLAVNFLDRFLCACEIRRNQLQLLAVVCLLLASKIRQCHSLSVDLLCFYSDHSIAPQEVLDWEMLVLSKLKWQMTAVTGCDLVDHVLERMTWSRGNTKLRAHSHTLLSFCYPELEFKDSRPSLLASASIVAAANGLKMSADAESALEAVCRLTGSDHDEVLDVVATIEGIMSKGSATFQFNMAPAVATPPPPPPPTKMADSPPTSPDTQPETPTDVQEIRF